MKPSEPYQLNFNFASDPSLRAPFISLPASRLIKYLLYCPFSVYMIVKTLISVEPQ